MKFKDLKKYIGTAVLAVLFSFSLSGCLDLTSTSETACPVTIVTSEEEISTETASPEDASPATASNATTSSVTANSDTNTLDSNNSLTTESDTNSTSNPSQSEDSRQSLLEEIQADVLALPAYSKSASIKLNNNTPYFTEDEIAVAASNSYEAYSPLDSLDRCGITQASLSLDTMPTEERGEIGSVKPSGWHTVKYDGIDGNYLYNRCHLIGYQLSGENSNTRNLITGTRYMNVEGMLPYENKTADYIKSTGNHVLYRVIPIFEGDNLLASGVTMEAYSIEDAGKGLSFCVYCYNVQPGITINYVNGDSTGPAFTGSTTGSTTGNTTDSKTESKTESTEQSSTFKQNNGNEISCTYILNTNTRKFHRPDCSSVKKMKDKNKAEFTGTREEAIAAGYDPCGNCNP